MTTNTDNFNDVNKSISTKTNEQLMIDSGLKAKEAIAKIQNLQMTESEKSKDNFYFPHKPVGKTAAILNTVFGSILTVGFGIPVFVLALLGGNESVILGLSAPLTVGLVMDASAAILFDRVKRYKRYLSLFKGTNFCFVDELAEYSGRSKRYVIRDLRKMLSRGTFPQAHLTQDNSLLLLTRDSYERYILEQRKRKLLGDAIETETDVQLIEESNSTVSEGKEYIRQVHALNLQLRDQEIKSKTMTLENIIRQIIGHVEKHPDQIGNVRRFIQFYLPSTVKLLTVFEEMEQHAIEGENIQTTKSEISKSLDMINAAFEKLFNNLFAGISVDISSDISVLNTLLTEDGLMKDEFKS